MVSHVNDPKKPVILLGSREEINSALKDYEDKFKDSRGHKLRFENILVAVYFKY